VKIYSEAVESLRQIRGYELHSEYKSLWTMAAEALLASTSVQRQLGRHIVTQRYEIPVTDRDKALSA